MELKKKKEKNQKASRRKPRAVRPQSEWVGGRRSSPFVVDNETEHFRPILALWLELPSDLIIAQDLSYPNEAGGTLARTLDAALQRPMAGPKRRPASIRVATAADAAEIRGLLGDAIPVRVSPTPELDEIVEAMAQSMPAPRADETYLQGGRIPADAVHRLFESAHDLFRVAPWSVASEDQVLRMDIPELGVDGACLSIIGAAADLRGLLIYPSLAGYEAFAAASEDPERAAKIRDLGTDWLALSFESKRGLPAAMLREIAAHEWPLAARNAYPHLQSWRRTATTRPLTERDVRIADAAASAVAAFVLPHQTLFETEQPEPVCASYVIDDDLEVRITAPYAALSPPLRELRNTDGERFLFTTDTFKVAPGGRADVEAALASMDGVQAPDDDESEPGLYLFVRPGNAATSALENTVIGEARVAGGRLRLTTNSRERADALRARVEQACGRWLRHHGRSHEDPLSKRAAQGRAEGPAPIEGPEADQAILELKKRHYADWADHPLPALGGKTPREATRTAAGRTKVDRLLKTMEHAEEQSAPGAAFDFSGIRRQLGLE